MKLIYSPDENGYYWEAFINTGKTEISQLFKTERGAELSRLKGKLRCEEL